MENKLPEKKQNQRLLVLRNTVAQGATDSEFAMFLEFCKGTKLNPFKREIWFVKTKGYQKRDGTKVEGKVQIMTGVNGFFAIANAHPMFDGMETELLKNEDGTLEGATAKVYRKDRKFPSVATAYFKEYYRPAAFTDKKSIWDEKPSHMITKVAKSIALREAFPQELGGLHTDDEMGIQQPKFSFEQATDLNQVKNPEISEADIEEIESSVIQQPVVTADEYEQANLKAEKEHYRNKDL